MNDGTLKSLNKKSGSTTRDESSSPYKAGKLEIRLLHWIVGFWFFAVFYAFGRFILADYRSFYDGDVNRLVEFEKRDFSKGLETFLKLKGIYDPNRFKVYLYHFWNDHCSCDGFNQAHVKRLIEDYAHKNVKFLIVPTDNEVDVDQEWQAQLLQYPNHVEVIAFEELNLPVVIPASPSAAVLNENGDLVYYGPYALGGICRPDENGLIETVIKGTLNQVPPEYAYVGGFGCFCAWPTSGNRE